MHMQEKEEKKRNILKYFHEIKDNGTFSYT